MGARNAVTWKNMGTVSGAGALAAAARSGQNIGAGIANMGKAFGEFGDDRIQRDTDNAVNALRAAAPEDRVGMMEGFANGGISLDSKQIGAAADKIDSEERANKAFEFQEEQFAHTKDRQIIDDQFKVDKLNHSSDILFRQDMNKWEQENKAAREHNSSRAVTNGGVARKAVGPKPQQSDYQFNQGQGQAQPNGEQAMVAAEINAVVEQNMPQASPQEKAVAKAQLAQTAETNMAQAAESQNQVQAEAAVNPAGETLSAPEAAQKASGIDLSKPLDSRAIQQRVNEAMAGSGHDTTAGYNKAESASRKQVVMEMMTEAISPMLDSYRSAIAGNMAKYRGLAGSEHNANPTSDDIDGMSPEGVDKALSQMKDDKQKLIQQLASIAAVNGVNASEFKKYSGIEKMDSEIAEFTAMKGKIEDNEAAMRKTMSKNVVKLQESFSDNTSKTGANGESVVWDRDFKEQGMSKSAFQGHVSKVIKELPADYGSLPRGYIAQIVSNVSHTAGLTNEGIKTGDGKDWLTAVTQRVMSDVDKKNGQYSNLFSPAAAKRDRNKIAEESADKAAKRTQPKTALEQGVGALKQAGNIIYGVSPLGVGESIINSLGIQGMKTDITAEGGVGNAVDFLKGKTDSIPEGVGPRELDIRKSFMNKVKGANAAVDNVFMRGLEKAADKPLNYSNSDKPTPNSFVANGNDVIAEQSGKIQGKFDSMKGLAVAKIKQVKDFIGGKIDSTAKVKEAEAVIADTFGGSISQNLNPTKSVIRDLSKELGVSQKEVKAIIEEMRSNG